MNTRERVHVAVGVIANDRGEVLIARRAKDAHQGGLWEFPGGKLEAGETVCQALERELQEELGIRIHRATPLICIPFDYSDKSVLLDVWRVESFSGQPAGLQQQPLKWVPVKKLHEYPFPQANQPIVTALRLPREMIITGAWTTVDEFEHRLAAALNKGVRLVQLRAHHCRAREYQDLFNQAKRVCDSYGALLIPNTSPEIFQKLLAEGLHLTSKRLMALRERPVSKAVLLGASCHNLPELRQAEALGVDYATLGPVLATPTHPEGTSLGFEQFFELLRSSPVPVFGLGGLVLSDKNRLLEAGAYGISGIRLWW